MAAKIYCDLSFRVVTSVINPGAGKKHKVLDRIDPTRRLVGLIPEYFTQKTTFDPFPTFVKKV